MRAIFVVLSVLLLAGVSFSLTNINSCAILNQSGETYYLTANVSGAPYPYYSGAYNTCIQINGSNILLDCQGYSITATDETGVEIEAPGTAVRVQNCTINAEVGVSYRGLSGGRIVTNRINPTYAGIDGVLASSASGNDILYNNITGGTYGIWIPGDNSLIGNNRLINQGSIGIDDWGTGNWITNNYVSGSGDYGIMVSGDNQYVSSNTVSNCDEAGIFMGAQYATVSTNYVSGTSSHGIQVGDGYYVTYLSNITGNHVYSNGGDGIHVEGGDYNRITGNEVYGNSRGIYFMNGYYIEGGWNLALFNTVSGNHVYSNSGNGIHAINLTFNNFTSNNASSNGGRGLVAENCSNMLINPSYFCNNSGGEGLLVSSSTNVTILNSVACNNAYHGIHLYNTDASNVSGNTAYDNGGDGIALDAGSDGNYVFSNTAYGNTGAFNTATGSDGIYLNGSSSNMLAGNTAYGNLNTGISVTYGSGNSLIGNSAYGQQRWYGIYLRNTNGNTLAGNTAYNNVNASGGTGFVINGGSGNNLSGNSAYGNALDGYYLLSSTTSNTLSGNYAYSNGGNGFYVYSSSGNNLSGNEAYQQPGSGFYLYSSSGNTVSGNRAHNNNYGFNLGAASTSGNSINGNSAYDNTDNGFYVGSAQSNNFRNNSAYGNAGNGIHSSYGDFNTYTSNVFRNNAKSGFWLQASDNNNLVNNTMHGNSEYGLYVNGLFGPATNNAIYNTTLYNNTIADFHANSSALALSYQMYNTTFRDNAGAAANFTALSMNDSFTDGRYTVDWTPGFMGPFLHYSFEQKFVNITSFTPGHTIDAVAWHWTDAEASGYNESKFQLFRHNATGWSQSLNYTPDTSANTLALYSHEPGSPYAILFNTTNISLCGNITAPGSYNLIQDIAGSTVPVSLPIAGSPQFACIRISAPNVSVNCNGYDITGNLTTGATAGIAAQSGDNSRLANVTVRNCPSISNYSAGIYLRNVSEGNIVNVTSHDNRLVSGVGYLLYYSPNVNFTNTAAANGYTYGYYINLGSNNVRIVNSTARNSTNIGFYFSSSVSDAYITDSVAYNNNGTGILLDGSGYPYAARNNITNDPAFNADAGMIVSANNAIVEDNLATGATATPVPSWGYGFIIESGNVTFRRNLAYGNKFGIEAFGWDCNITNNTARDNLMDGFAFYSEDDSVSSNLAYDNGNNGFSMNYTTGTALMSNEAYGNGNNGFELGDANDNVDFSANRAHDNGGSGFLAAASEFIGFDGDNATANGGHGFALLETPDSALLSAVAQSNGGAGIIAYDSVRSLVDGAASCGNAGEQISLVNSSYSNVTGSYACSGARAGIYADGACGYLLIDGNTANATQRGFNIGAHNSTVSGNNATGCTSAGFYFNQSYDNAISGNGASASPSGFYFRSGGRNSFDANEAFNNGQTGVYLDGSVSNSLTGNSAHENGNFGIQLMFGSSQNMLSGNNAYGNGITNFYVYSNSNENLLSGNNASGGQIGFNVNVARDNNLTGNRVVGPGTGSAFLIETSNNTRLSGNTVQANARGITVQASSLDTVLDGNTVNGSTAFGLQIRTGANRTAVLNDHYFGNTPDFTVNGTGITINLSGVTFDNPAGDYTNYTNLSIEDTVDSAYEITWSDNSTALPLPGGRDSFAQKFVEMNVLEGPVSIEKAVWNWLESELGGGYDENYFYIHQFDNGTWTSLMADRDISANTLTVAGIADFSIFAILQYIPEEGEEGAVPLAGEYDVSIRPVCNGFMVSVKDEGSAVADAFVEIIDETNAVELPSAYTNESGQTYVPYCDIDVSIKASKSGRSGTEDGFAGCGFCPECATDEDCASSEQCLLQECVPINCPRGRVVDHACELYECMVDADCPAGQVCIDHFCELAYECYLGDANTTADDNDDCDADEYCRVEEGDPGGTCEQVEGCGEIIDHALVPWECGDMEACPACPEGELCIGHACVAGDLSCPASGLVGDRKNCSAKEDGQPCINCDYLVTDPAGKNFTGKTDASGNLGLPLSLEGNYRVALLKDGEVMKILTIRALPRSQPGDEGKPAATGFGEAAPLFLVIVLLFILGAILYWRRRGGGKKGTKK